MDSKKGEELRKIQLDLGLKAKDFAKELDVNPTYLSAMMHGKRKIPLSLVNRLTKKFEVNREYLFKLLNADKIQ